LIIPHAAASVDLAGQCIDDPEHASGGGDESPLHLWQSERRALVGDDQVTGERDLRAAAERGAVDRGDRRFVDEVVDVSGEAPLAVLGVVQVLPPRDRLEIGSGAKRSVARAGDHHGPHLGVGVRTFKGVADPDADGAVDRVARLRAVDRDDLDVAAPLDERGWRRSCHSSSTMVALAWPPPSHMVCSP
jgi:hypothetical protein